MKATNFDRDKFLSETWPNALESGEFKQGILLLYNGSKNMSGKYCCLGVACELLSRMKLLPRKAWIDETWLPIDARNLLGITAEGRYGKSGNLAVDNDNGKSFKWIASKIRQVAKSKRAGFVKIEKGTVS